MSPVPHRRTTITTTTMSETERQLGAGALYRLLAWLSPAFPVGAYSYSHGLEAAVDAGLVHDRVGLERWVATLVEYGAGRIDADLFRDAFRATPTDAAVPVPAELLRVATYAAIHRGTAETALESEGQGAAFLATVRAAWPDPFLDVFAASLDRACGYAVAVAVAAARAFIPLEPALAAYLHAIAANLVSAGVRLVPLGQTDGQRALAALEPVVQRAAIAALARPPENFGACAFAIDLFSMAHETQYTRLFRS
jgi:urease accessory protein